MDPGFAFSNDPQKWVKTTEHFDCALRVHYYLQRIIFQLRNLDPNYLIHMAITYTIHRLIIFYLIFLTEVIVIKKNSTNGKIVEEVTFGRSNSKRKTIDIKFPILSPTSRERSRKHKRFHHRRRCCETGDMAAKHGMSCNISRDFRRFFMNQTTRLRMKYQSSPDTGGNIRKRFRSPRIYRIYRKITRCIQQQLKSAVQKCCLAYVDMERSWKRQG